MIRPIEDLNRKELRKFGITTGIIAGVLFGLILPFLFSHAWPVWPWMLAGAFILWGLILPGSLQRTYKIWMTIGAALGWINTRIILGIIFFIIFTPISLILKILNKDAMTRKIHLPDDSYRVICHQQDHDHFERPY